MGNLRVAVNNAADQTEARNIMISLGYLPKEITCISGGDLGFVVNAHNENGATYKEITLPELRDLVVLKRNDVRDATHESPCGELKFILLGDWWNLFTGGKWQQFSHKQSPRCNKLKPIEKPMKEYLRKNSNGTYSYIGTVRPEHVSDFMIEIPEGAEIYIDLGFRNHSFYKDNFKLCWCGVRWENTVHNSVNLEHWNNTPVLWKRHTIPEELPFIDDEPLKVIDSEYSKDGNSVTLTVSLNDQYAEIEKVRQSAWQKQEGGAHYKNLKIQPMQYALENKLDYAQANVVKYVTRHADKNGKEDLLKAIHNIELMIDFYYGDEK